MRKLVSRKLVLQNLVVRNLVLQKLGVGLLAGAIALPVAAARDYRAGAIEIDNPWSRAVPKGASVAAGYVTIKNTGTEADRLVESSTPVAAKVEIHQMTMDNGVMRMRPLSGALEIKPGETVELKPQSLHFMMTGVRGPIEQGKPFKGTLVFEKAGPVEVEFSVEAPGAPAPGTKGAGTKASGGHDMHDMHDMH